MLYSKIKTAISYLFLILVILLPRLPALDRFVTLDEPSWLSQGANFYYAIAQREFENTVYEYQPAVTTMWIISLAMLMYFPEYRALEQGYLSYEKGLLDSFMVEHGYDPLKLLVLSRAIQVIVILILLLALYYLLTKLISTKLAVFSIIFISFDPYFLGLSRMMTHEAMMASFVLVSLIALTVYLYKDQNISYLLLSGVAAGFAQLSKSSSIAMLGGVGVLFLFYLIQNRNRGWKITITSSTKALAGWFAILVLTYYIFWPGMWVAPGKMIYEVYGNAFSYAFQGARLSVTEHLNVAEFSLNSSLNDVWGVAKVLLYRTTPLTWFGTLFSIILLFKLRQNQGNQNQICFSLLLANTLAFILLIGLAQGRNSPHYILSSYVSINLLAALGWGAFFQWLENRFITRMSFLSTIGLPSILIFQFISAISFFPYYYTYRNPILHAAGWYSEYPQKPYGEALEKAALYLAQMPDAADSTTFSYYSRGCFSYFYPGESISFRPYYVDGAHEEDLLNNLKKSNYLIIYYANQIQDEKYHRFIHIFESMEPLQVIWMDGYEYVRIYKVDLIPLEIFKELGDL